MVKIKSLKNLSVKIALQERGVSFCWRNPFAGDQSQRWKWNSARRLNSGFSLTLAYTPASLIILTIKLAIAPYHQRTAVITHNHPAAFIIIMCVHGMRYILTQHQFNLLAVWTASRQHHLGTHLFVLCVCFIICVAHCMWYYGLNARLRTSAAVREEPAFRVSSHSITEWLTRQHSKSVNVHISFP